MIDKKQAEQAFRKDLAELLKKHHATIETDDHHSGYAECGRDIRVEVNILASYDKDGNTLREWAEFDIGLYVSSDNCG